MVSTRAFFLTSYDYLLQMSLLTALMMQSSSLKVEGRFIIHGDQLTAHHITTIKAKQTRASSINLIRPTGLASRTAYVR
jgi:hypothetical protein